MNEEIKTRIKRQAAPLRQQVTAVIKETIVSGRMKPGQRLSERALMDLTGVSRTLIREALRQLEAEGLIEIIPNRGAVVRALSEDEAKDLYHIRAVLQGLAARFFVEHGSSEDIAELERALEAVARAYESEAAQRIIEEKNRFYDVLFDGAHSETLSSMLQLVHARVWRWRVLGLTHPHRSARRSRESLENLAKIVAAIKRRDAGKAESATRHEAQEAAREVMRLLAAEDR